MVFFGTGTPELPVLYYFDIQLKKETARISYSVYFHIIITVVMIPDAQHIENTIFVFEDLYVHRPKLALSPAIYISYGRYRTCIDFLYYKRLTLRCTKLTLSSERVKRGGANKTYTLGSLCDLRVVLLPSL
jgi:hypothetical protein